MNMSYARWYPSVTPMGNGEMLITSGGPPTPEVRQNDGTLRQLSNASLEPAPVPLVRRRARRARVRLGARPDDAIAGSERRGNLAAVGQS